MQPPLSRDTKFAVIEDWLLGRDEDEIAGHCLISAL
jgi:hypothetical protein